MNSDNVLLDEYIVLLREKGFKFEEDVLGFIYFGKHYTGASDQIIKAAIEITLKTQKYFDGSFYISLLESFKQNNIKTKKQAFLYVSDKGILTA